MVEWMYIRSGRAKLKVPDLPTMNEIKALIEWFTETRPSYLELKRYIFDTSFPEKEQRVILKHLKDNPEEIHKGLGKVFNFREYRCDKY